MMMNFFWPLVWTIIIAFALAVAIPTASAPVGTALLVVVRWWSLDGMRSVL